MAKRIPINTKNSVFFIDPTDILYCQSDNTTTTLFLQNGETIVVSKGIKLVQKMLEGNNFLRPHQSYLVNRNHIILIDKTPDYCLILKNQIKIPISTRKRKEIMEIIKSSVINTNSF